MSSVIQPPALRERPRILVVEDDAEVAGLLKNLLTKCDYRIAAVVGSGEEALSLLLDTSPDPTLPDLILMDISLSHRLDGIETAAEIRKRLDLPVVFLTGHADENTLDRAKRTGPFGYVVKPFRLDALRSVIELAIDRHRTEMRLRQRESWLSSALRSSSDLTIVIDRNCRLCLSNPAAERMLGLNADTLTGALLDEVILLTQSQAPLSLESLAQSAMRSNTNTPIPGGCQLHTQRSANVPVEGEIIVSSLDAGVAGAVVTLRDITVRLREEQQRAHNQKMIAVGRVAGGVAHDFNNLLAIILGYGERLRKSLADSAADPAPRADFLERILGAARNAAVISQQMLTLSGNRVLPAESLDVNHAVSSIVEMLRGGVGNRIRLETFFHEEAGKVQINSGQFSQVLMNLILNARDALGESGVILVSTSRHLGFARILVADNGPGIPPEIAAHIFDPFFTTKAEGNGLGLSIAYGIVTTAGGQISLQSASGAGAIFEILLPQVESEADEPEAQPVRKVSAAPGKTILLVDDEPGLPELLGSFLADEGHSVLTAAGGSEALQKAASHTGEIDVLITDVTMPDMEGPELATRMSQIRPRTRVLFISGHAPNLGNLLRDTGNSGAFLQKPFSPDALLAKLASLLPA